MLRRIRSTTELFKTARLAYSGRGSAVRSQVWEVPVAADILDPEFMQNLLRGSPREPFGWPILAPPAPRSPNLIALRNVCLGSPPFQLMTKSCSVGNNAAGLHDQFLQIDLGGRRGLTIKFLEELHAIKLT